MCVCVCVCVCVVRFVQIVKSTGMQCLDGLFSSRSGPQGLTAKLNGRIISVSGVLVYGRGGEKVFASL